MESTYETDFYAWTQKAAQDLRDGSIEPDELANVIEEIEDLGRSRYDSLVSHLAVLLSHKLKWEYQPDRRSRSWTVTINTEGVHVNRILRRNPSLKSRLETAYSDAYSDAMRLAKAETGLPKSTFPAMCPYPLDRVLLDSEESD